MFHDAVDAWLGGRCWSSGATLRATAGDHGGRRRRRSLLVVGGDGIDTTAARYCPRMAQGPAAEIDGRELVASAHNRVVMSNMGSIDAVVRTEGTHPRVLDSVHGLTEEAKPVWVWLDALFIRDAGTPVHTNGAGVDMTGEVPGRLTHGVPTVRGDWLVGSATPCPMPMVAHRFTSRTNSSPATPCDPARPTPSPTARGRGRSRSDRVGVGGPGSEPAAEGGDGGFGFDLHHQTRVDGEVVGAQMTQHPTRQPTRRLTGGGHLGCR
jgi:hypothetical protein